MARLVLDEGLRGFDGDFLLTVRRGVAIHRDGRVGRDADAVDGIPAGRHVARRRVAQGTAEREGTRDLHRPLPHRRRPHDSRAIEVAEGGGEGFGRTGGIAVHQHYERSFRGKVTRHLARRGGSQRIDLDDRAALDEQRGDIDRLRKISARIVAQVEHERARAFVGQLGDGLAHEGIGIRGELLERDVADLVRKLRRDVGFLVASRRQRGRELFAARRIEALGMSPAYDDGRAGLALNRVDGFGRGPVLGGIPVDRHHEIAGLHPRFGGGRAFEHVERVRLAVVFGKEHADSRIIGRRRIDVSRVAIGIVIARIGIARRLQERS